MTIANDGIVFHWSQNYDHPTVREAKGVVLETMEAACYIFYQEENRKRSKSFRCSIMTKNASSRNREF